MVKVTYKGVEYNVVLIDPSIATAGNGATVSTALKDFPTVLENNTCYLVRRTDPSLAHAFVTYQTGNTLKNIMILGMPKSTDKQWIQDLITDDEINNAWKADTAEYACIKFPHKGNESWNGTNSYVVASNVLEQCIGINLYCFRRELDTYGQYHRQCTAMFGNRNITKYLTNFEFYNTKFGVLGYDLDKEEWRSTNTRVSSNGSTNKEYFDVYGVNYITAQYLHSLILDNCIINNHPGDAADHQSQSLNGSAIFVQHIFDVDMNNSTFYNLGPASDNNSDYPTFRLLNIKGNGNFTNIVYHPVIYTNRVHALGFISNLWNYDGNVIVDNVKITPVALNVSKPTAVIGAYCSGLRICRYGGSGDSRDNFKHLEVRNFNVDCSTGPVKLGQGHFITIHSGGCGIGTPLPDVIENINIKLHDVAEECFIPVTIGSENHTSCISMIATMGSSGHVTNDGVSGNINNKASIAKLRNINISSPLAGAAFFENVVIDLDVLEASLIVQQSQVQINKQIIKHPGYAITCNTANNYVRVKDLVVPEARDIEKSIVNKSFGGGGQNIIYIDKCNQEEVFPGARDTTVGDQYVFSNDICCSAGADGKFVQCNRNVDAQSWSVTRNGSNSPASLRLVNNTTKSANSLWVGLDPFKGFKVVPTKIGRQNIVAYFAYKNFAVSDESVGKTDMVIHASVPYRTSDGQLTYKHYSSNFTSWTEDNSTWTDPDAVARKMVFPVEITTLDPIDIKVQYKWFSQSGLVYFDPDVRIENM